uniref:P4Hc domain-containing protein n=1 Tax=Angiostrongylus cantonensis TaxID=6313 RepID=A0A158P9Y5_ANGCA
LDESLDHDVANELLGGSGICLLVLKKHPFPHWQLRDFLHVDPSVLERIEAELISYPSWNRKENDLYSLFQTPDLHAIEKAEHPAIANFRDFLCDEIRTWLENVSGVELLSQVDATGSCYASTDCLLPHSDEVDNRRFAFVYYFTQEPWEESFGGQTNIYNKDCEPTTIFTSLLPYRNSLLLFEVSDRSWHSVAEVLGEDNDPRLSINGWFHSSRYIKPRVRSALILLTSISFKKKKNKSEILPEFHSCLLTLIRGRAILISCAGPASFPFFQNFSGFVTVGPQSSEPSLAKVCSRSSPPQALASIVSRSGHLLYFLFLKSFHLYQL